MKKLKMWFINTFLPAWAKLAMLDELRKLQKKNSELEEENYRLNAYIDGLQWGVRAQRRIIINTGEEKK